MEENGILDIYIFRKEESLFVWFFWDLKSPPLLFWQNSLSIFLDGHRWEHLDFFFLNKTNQKPLLGDHIQIYITIKHTNFANETR